MAKFEMHYSLRGSITIEADNEQEARERLLSSDYTETSQLFSGVEQTIIEAGNDAIDIDDVYKTED